MFYHFTIRNFTVKQLEMKRLKPNNCTVCGKYFMPSRIGQEVCGWSCAIALGKSNIQKQNSKAWQKEKMIRKEKLKTHKDWIQDLQKDFNTFIRLRDRDQPCISCGTTRVDIKYDAGHFWTTGGFPNVRFDEDNVHKQCSNNCNFKKSGNINEYRPRLVEKIGIERFEALEFRARNGVLKLSIPEIKEKIEYYRKRIKELKTK